jgi:uncharacterized protein (DUF362 family)
VKKPPPLPDPTPPLPARDEPPTISRRAFLTRVAACTAAASGLALGLEPLGRRAWAATARPLLAVARNGSPEALTRAAIEELGGMGKFVARGDVVLVKPNIGWDRSPEQAANTNPEVVRTVVQLCLDAGAKRVRVMDRTCNDPRRCYRTSGIKDAVEGLGSPAVSVEFMDERKFVPVAFDRGETLKKWLVSEDYLGADKRINLAIAKHHNAARLTMTLKNTMGVLGGNRGTIHHDLDQNIADMNTRLAFDLYLLDAVRILVGNGPQGGRLSDVKRKDVVIAGRDPVAVDAYGATLFGITGADVSHVAHAARLGLGEIDLAKTELRQRDLGAG